MPQLDKENNIFLFLVPGQGQEKTDYMVPAIREYIVPSLLARRAKLERIDQDERDEAGTPSGPVRKKRIITTFDGEHMHLEATLDLPNDNVPPEWRHMGIELLFAAATSKYPEQPSDTECSYESVLKAAEKSDSDLPPCTLHGAHLRHPAREAGARKRTNVRALPGTVYPTSLGARLPATTSRWDGR